MLITEPQTSVLTDRWTPLKHHPIQHKLWHSRARFCVVAAGRRSGKTELAKRKLVKEAIRFHKFPDGWFIAGAPTLPQSRRIYWDDLKRLVPSCFVQRIYETDLTIKLVSGTCISVIGMDDPQRAEGKPLDGCILDEYADQKASVFPKHLRPALSTLGRPGWCWAIGVPEGRNHFYKFWTRAREDQSGTWEAYHWTSESVLDPLEIAAAKSELDELTYAQEYLASFLNFEGRAYYAFNSESNCANLSYNPNLPLIICLDFNVKPGVAAICQEQMYRGPRTDIDKKAPVTCVIGEVWIPDNSTTERVCKKIVRDWGAHKGEVYLYGDATGGARGSAAVRGSNWDLVQQILHPEFEGRLFPRYPRQNPPERPRINAVNARMRTADLTVKCLIDPRKAPHLVTDLEGVSLIEGGAGEIDKFADSELTHISDAFGYYIVKKFPVEGSFDISSTEI